VPRLELAVVTKPDRELIAEAVAAGRLRRIPAGVSGLPAQLLPERRSSPRRRSALARSS
jgi:hypothetical protein